MKKICLIGADSPLTRRLTEFWTQDDAIKEIIGPVNGDALETALGGVDAVVYLAGSLGDHGQPPEASVSSACLSACREAGIGCVVVVSSAAIHPPRHGHPGMVGEIAPARADACPISRPWLELEQMAETILGSDAALTILRPAPTAVPGGTDPLSRLLEGKLGNTLPGHDPTVQILSPTDLARAIAAVIAKDRSGLYNVAPAGNIPLRKAMNAAGTFNLPMPGLIQRVTGTRPGVFLDAIKYNFTVCGRKIQDELGFKPLHSSFEAATAFRTKPVEETEPAFDEHGYERRYTDLLRATNFKFLHDLYWRVECTGTEHIPKQGAGILVGVHRGFMPFDGAMCLTQLAKKTGRYPRFLIHPCLVKPAFQADFIRRIGGVIACRENADKLLADGELVGIYPEGIAGAFTLYKDAYRLGNFGRDEYVKIALRNGAPIVPFATVGSAEIYPILGKIHWGWLRRNLEWPFLPVTPTPVPLPSKWHTRYMEPIPIGELYPPETADDPVKVRAIGKDIEQRLLNALEQMRRERKNIFFGSIFDKNKKGQTVPEPGSL
ncbi:MAG: 1-acyl-sn-glycerol-3-phosphate acyltransferase [Acidobacteriota bacterium]|nr:1-acyl-sn-glycerol-3-phosphate acyltransferase [Acidobacteriota bacterium]